MSLSYNDQEHAYSLDGQRLVSVTEVLRETGFIDTEWYTETGRERGSKVHESCHLFDLYGIDEDDAPEICIPYLQAYKQFLKDTGFTIVESEIPKYHQTYLFAGTPDKKGMFRDDTVPAIVDLKTGTLEDWTAIQTGAYSLFFSEHHTRWGLQLKNDGTYRLKQYSDRNDRNIFLSALAVMRWQTNHRG